LPEFGTLPEFQRLVTEAHQRGIRIIVDLVMNHTSDQHPWFQASRSDPDGPYGDFYVWSDTDTGYADARIIFVDTETSNWTFDPVRRQYFWHRFFSHQPDLNFENPDVQEAMFDAVRFWMEMGIDGFRLDAVPYLFEEEGTNGENLPQTHDFLKKLRKMVDEEFPGRVLLAEANQWPFDVVEYFGTEEEPECHMCFHFPVMPRLYYSLREEKATPIIDILSATPEIPVSSGQWGTFLRNHDELTLEMVTTEERAAMYGWYAPDPRMRANIGIRRRLAPLLDNSRPEIQLIHAMVLSLPGSPCLYYGDEIGMGDNIWLDDRDAVRTPMQWTPDRNAGFSSADPGKLYLPTVQSLVYNYQAVNVEAQLASTSSLLHWVRGILAVRKQHPVFGTGRYVPLTSRHPLAHGEDAEAADGPDVAGIATHAVATTRQQTPAQVGEGQARAGEEALARAVGATDVRPDAGFCDNDAVLAFLRVLEGGQDQRGETVLCVNNLSATPQSAHLRIPGYEGASVHDLFGGARFPAIDDEGCTTLTLGSRGFFWLRLDRPGEGR
ncbi:maltose alpha-D-glucosyltransferase, partial [Kineococcus glutinatus]|uniref:maltose alpha-D-glucosyltransferase n=1 Tax=Kineococcus glutinatus TaxID=1070872 RepID=UPI003CD0746C